MTFDSKPHTDLPNLGACCACGRTDVWVRNIMMLDLRAPVPGTGWGCEQCHLPLDGALAVLCDACVAASATLHFVVSGRVPSHARLPIEQVTESFGHALSQHPEILDDRRARQAHLN